MPRGVYVHGAHRPASVHPGDKFGRLTVLAYDKSLRGQGRIFRCTCRCGNVVSVQGNNLRSGHTTSCGCARGKHYGINLPEYASWKHMKRRCYNQNADQWPHYGGRGITVCKRWKNSFVAFLKDVGPRPSPKHSIERIKNNGNYTPRNVRWATQAEQLRNTRRTRFITHNGITLPLVDWAHKVREHPRTVWGRLDRGYTVKEALFGRSKR